MGVKAENIVEPTLPHSEFGDPDCCGCLIGVIRGEEANIACNECLAVIRSVPTGDLQRTFDLMELTLNIASEKYPTAGR